MTLPPERIGDKGQRYQIEAIDYPKPGLNVIGWASAYPSATRMAYAIITAPSCTGAWIRDRQEGSSTFFMYD